MPNNEWHGWLFEKFSEWEKSTGRRQTYSAFAKYLGVTQPSLSQWLAGNYPPQGDNLRKIAEKCGTEIYELLGLGVPPDLERDRRLSQLSPELRELYKRDLEAFIEEWLRRHGWRKID